MVLTDKQERGLKEILTRHRNGEKYTVISGYAGTGKSTLVKFAIDALDPDPTRVAYATFTGKAAEVLRKKGNDGATTLHKLLYDHIPKPTGGFFRVKKKDLGVDIVVVDEVSMVPQTMIDILLRHQIYIIFLGDPFQIPAIDKDEQNHLLDHPHVFLDEVMRQAAESEIIRMTMQIRNFEAIPFSKGEEVMVMRRRDIVDGCYTWADQIIAATNATRRQINNYMRQVYGYEGSPKAGEKMICLRNYWNDCAANGDALVNGTTGIIQVPTIETISMPYFIRKMYPDLCPTSLDYIRCNFISDTNDENSIFENIGLDRKLIENGEKSLDWRIAYAMNRRKTADSFELPKEFDFGYCITGHKSQGSQWEKVLVIEEDFPFNKQEHAQWLYTCCTRPEKKLVLAR